MAYKNKEDQRDCAHRHYLKNREKILLRHREWQKNNPGKTAIYAAKYKAKDPAAYLDKARLWRKKQRQTNPLWKLKANLRVRLWAILVRKGLVKETTATDLLGAPISLVKKWIEEKFQGGMLWENYGKWEIDHIIPLASAKTQADIKRLFHYKNLQPLWFRDNRSKGAA